MSDLHECMNCPRYCEGELPTGWIEDSHEEYGPIVLCPRCLLRYRTTPGSESRAIQDTEQRRVAP